MRGVRGGRLRPWIGAANAVAEASAKIKRTSRMDHTPWPMAAWIARAVVPSRADRSSAAATAERTRVSSDGRGRDD